MRNLILFFILFSILDAKETNLNFQNGNKFYIEKKYNDAIKEYEAILSLGIESPEVHFNIANSYFKINNLGKAILHFEKANKLDRNSEDILFNLKYAQAKRIDKIDLIPEFFLKTWLLNINNIFSSGIGFIIMYLGFLFGLIFLTIVYFYSSLNRKVFYVGIILSLLSFCTILIYEYGESEKSSKNEGIITTSIVNIKLSPARDSEDAFLLHEGTKFILLDNVGTWFKIQLSDGKIGWIESTNFGKI